jgi:hypothetical protein
MRWLLIDQPRCSSQLYCSSHVYASHGGASRANCFENFCFGGTESACEMRAMGQLRPLCQGLATVKCNTVPGHEPSAVCTVSSCQERTWSSGWGNGDWSRAPDRTRAGRLRAARLAPFAGRSAPALPHGCQRHMGSRLSDGNPHGTPVDRDVGAADVAGQRRSQERHYSSDLLRLAEASGRNVVANEGLPRRLGGMQPL